MRLLIAGQDGSVDEAATCCEPALRTLPGLRSTIAVLASLRCIAGKPFLPSPKEILRPAIIRFWTIPSRRHSSEILSPPAQALRHEGCGSYHQLKSAAESHDGCPLRDLFGRFFHRHEFLAHLRSLTISYGEPEILPSSTHSICLASADGQPEKPSCGYAIFGVVRRCGRQCSQIPLARARAR